MFKITFKKSVAKDLKRISKDQVKKILNKIESNLSTTPELKGKFAGLRKFRVGNYRIIFAILEEETVLITRIKHRRETYK